jgi:hypothetical protein
MIMVGRTLPFKARDKPKPTEPLPSIPLEKMEHQQTPAEQLRHANEQIALTRQYPGRKGDIGST